MHALEQRGWESSAAQSLLGSAIFISSELGVRPRMVGKKLPCFFLPCVLELCATFQ